MHTESYILLYTNILHKLLRNVSDYSLKSNQRNFALKSGSLNFCTTRDFVPTVFQLIHVT